MNNKPDEVIESLLTYTGRAREAGLPCWKLKNRLAELVGEKILERVPSRVVNQHGKTQRDIFRHDSSGVYLLYEGSPEFYGSTEEVYIATFKTQGYKGKIRRGISTLKPLLEDLGDKNPPFKT